MENPWPWKGPRTRSSQVPRRFVRRGRNSCQGRDARPAGAGLVPISRSSSRSKGPKIQRMLVSSFGRFLSRSLSHSSFSLRLQRRKEHEKDERERSAGFPPNWETTPNPNFRRSIFVPLCLGGELPTAGELTAPNRTGGPPITTLMQLLFPPRYPLPTTRYFPPLHAHVRSTSRPDRRRPLARL